MNTKLLCLGNLQVDFTKRLLSIDRFDDDHNSNATTSTRQQKTLTVKIGCAIIDQTIQIREYFMNDNLLIIKTDDGTELVIKYETSEQLYEKYDIKWKNSKGYHFMKDVIQIDPTSQWYGGPELAQQSWPLADTMQSFSPYLSSDTLKADPFSPTLSYSIYAAKRCTLREFHVILHGILYDKCITVADEGMIRKPIWSTWARYSEKVTQHDVLEFAEEILNNHAPICQLELDDKWSSHYGDFEFDRMKFPDVNGMCKQLNDWEIRLTLWIHPFINLDSNNGQNPTLRHLFVKDCNGEPGIVQWWRGRAYMIDFTNPEAVGWFCEELEKIRKLGIFSFKFDAGEVTYLPVNFRLHSGTSPNDFSEAYVRTAASFGNTVEVRVFRRTQSLPIFYRTMDRLSTWNNIGLNTVIPVALNFGLHGYYFNLPDMIGGNGYNDQKCSKELYIRWMQANQFLLTMQFSYPPWLFDDETCDIFHRIIEKRNELLNFLIEACRKSCEGGQPVIRPLWWLSEEPEALCCDDQFIIDDSMIVAPILIEGARSRIVFLPDGTWQYELTGDTYIGPIKLTVEAPLTHHAPPYFTRVG
uniref:Glycoside hydrolase family 31 N-terminal domain-containing protein n=1 Tax=Setaria digitata TaxID=48799 RepID=A0A915PRE5_9BILA